MNGLQSDCGTDVDEQGCECWIVLDDQRKRVRLGLGHSGHGLEQDSGELGPNETKWKRELGVYSNTSHA